MLPEEEKNLPCVVSGAAQSWIHSPQCQGPESNLERDRQPQSITEVGFRCLPLPLFGGCSVVLGHLFKSLQPREMKLGLSFSPRLFSWLLLAGPVHHLHSHSQTGEVQL